MDSIEKIAELAPRVAEIADAQSAAYAEQCDAETALLDRVGEIVRPALRGLSSRIKIGERVWWPDNVCTESDETYEGRGVCLSDDSPGPVSGRGNRGQYSGTDLFLMADGSWLELVYDGHWSRWQGESEEWTSEQRCLSTREVAAEYDVDELLENLAKLLQSQVDGRREKATRRALERATKLRAIVELL